MKGLPSNEIVLLTDLSKEEVCERLAGELREPILFRYLFFDKEACFEGTILNDVFTFSLITPQPKLRVKGYVTESEGRTYLKTKFSLRRFPFLFSVFWVGSLTLVFLLFGISILNGGDTNPLALLISPGMIGFWYLTTMVAFTDEKNLAVSFLERVAEAKVIREK